MEVPAQGKGPDQGAARALRVTSFSVLKDPVTFDSGRLAYTLGSLKRTSGYAVRWKLLFVLLEMFSISKWSLQSH